MINKINFPHSFRIRIFLIFVKEISPVFAGVPWLLFRRSLNGDCRDILQHQLLELIEQHNPLQENFELIESAVRFLYLSGNAYLEFVGPGDRSAAPKELFLRPDPMRVVPDPIHFVSA